MDFDHFRLRKFEVPPGRGSPDFRLLWRVHHIAGLMKHGFSGRVCGFWVFVGVTLLAGFCATTVNAQFASNYTPTYPEIVEAYRTLAENHPETTRLVEAGETDAGQPLHALIIDGKGGFSPASARENEQVVCLVLNGIHPGEPAGINAAIDFAGEKASEPGEDVVYVVVPVYNIGGALNRNSHTRYNQEGPESYGFRGNARNLDLNRDFIKCDSRNALSFTRLFHRWKPHVFIDTHTSNGADYQPTMTLLSAFPERLVPMQQSFVEREMLPALYERMAERGERMVPYVQLSGRTPEEGLVAFTDHPRYGSGYATLFNTLAFVTEAHMLKPFDRRVEATLTFLQVMDGFLTERKDILLTLKSNADELTAESRSFDSGWRLSEEVDSLEFPGYEADVDTLPSGVPVPRYDRDRPYLKMVPFRNRHVADSRTELPRAYVIPGAWKEVLERLEANDIDMRVLKNDTTMEVTADYVEEYETVEPPYEGHYLHYNTSVRPRTMELTFHPGDVIVPANQPGNRYLAATLDPRNVDSFFNWNFFDSVLRKKEYASPYLFAEDAREILRRNPRLREAFEDRLRNEPGFKENTWEQIGFILDHSQMAEMEFKRIPVYRLE